MKKVKRSNDPNYGISRFDSDVHQTHGWRVSLRRRGKRLVRNFPDKKFGGKQTALKLARQFRDELLVRFPPISRKEMCRIKRSNNKSGIPGVYSYTKSYTLRDGTIRETKYWEANWPVEGGENESINFSVRKYGEEIARSMAIRARQRGMAGVEGPFWASERGLVEPPVQQPQLNDDQDPIRHVA